MIAAAIGRLPNNPFQRTVRTSRALLAQGARRAPRR